MRKKLWLIIGLGLTVLALFLAGCEGITSPAPEAPSVSGIATSPQSTGIWVNGEGKTTVVPDVAVVTLGVQAQEATVAQAQGEAATAMNAVTAELKAGGVADKDIKTQIFNIQQLTRWDNDKQQQVVIGYQVNNMVTAKIREVAKTGTIIDAVVRAGGNYTRINSVSFTVDDPTPYQRDARQKAMADAQSRAKQLADAAGVKLGAPTYINESGGYVPVPVVTMAAPAPTAAPATPISPGETEITINVQVVYSIR